MRRAWFLVAVSVGWLVSGPAGAVTDREFADLAARCAPSVHPQTLAAVVRHESAFNALAIGVNGAPKRKVRATSAREAARIASDLIAQGRSVDMGLGQINSANLKWLGLSVQDVFDPCLNLAAAAKILTGNYLRALGSASSEQAALDTALSLYNTGHPRKGLRNGYVAGVRDKAAPAPPDQAAVLAEPAPWDAFAQANARRPQWDVFTAREKPPNGGSTSWGGR